MDPTDVVRMYYDAIDAGEYDRLADMLDADFVHERPDRTLEGPDRFVEFMAEERPQTDTEHRVDRVYTGPAGHVAVGGRLLDVNARLLFEFVDAFQIDDETVAALRTYARGELPEPEPSSE